MKFDKYIGKNNSLILTNKIKEYSLEYVENNCPDCPFLLDEIIETKINYLLDVFKKNKTLVDMINNNEIEINKICYLSLEELEPDKFKPIIEKKEVQEMRRNSQLTSNAFKCKKCGESKCQVTQKQTRSGDEPATTFVNCMECGFTFKF